jgi:hypothetical protein
MGVGVEVILNTLKAEEKMMIFKWSKRMAFMFRML